MKCPRYKFLIYIGVAKVFLFALSLSAFLVFFMSMSCTHTVHGIIIYGAKKIDRFL